ncbi:MAG: hypothetical protein R3A51_13730 [Nannocystaceae bacterium]
MTILSLKNLPSATPLLYALACAFGLGLGACDLPSKPIGDEYEPCADKSCGDPCTVCAPNDPDCVETQVLKVCDPEGQCVSAAVSCEMTYEPCADKLCGAPCTVCDPDDPDCVETQVLKVCDPEGACTPDTGDLICGEPPYEPCADKLCGDACQLCDPDDPDCAEDLVLKSCDPEGVCTPGEVVCSEPYEPCADKQCGDMCQLCDPDDPDCVEDQVVKVCDLEGACTPDTGDILCGEPPYEPCAGKQCGDTCQLCDPDDLDCAEDDVIKVCDPDGVCVADNDEVVCEPYEPCAGKQCGDMCQLCDPNDPDCAEDLVVKLCDAEGACTPDAPMC